MSDLESICHALEESVQPLPGLADSLRLRASRLRSIAAEVDGVARQVNHGPDVSRVVHALHEAAAALDASGQSLAGAAQQSQSYVAQTIGGGGAGGAPPATGGSAGDASLGSVGGGQGLPDGWAIVPLSAINDSDSRVTGPESFGKGYSPQDLAWACTALHDVVLPAMSRGEGTDYFQQLDQTEGRMGVRSYDDTYRGFFGTDSPIKLDPCADGTYEVENGYHRIWVARRLGLPSVPARIK